jgi:hypothetical protein
MLGYTTELTVFIENQYTMDKLFIIKIDTASYQANNLLWGGCRFLRVQARSGILKKFPDEGSPHSPAYPGKVEERSLFPNVGPLAAVHAIFSLDSGNRRGIHPGKIG